MSQFDCCIRLSTLNRTFPLSRGVRKKPVLMNHPLSLFLFHLILHDAIYWVLYYFPFTHTRTIAVILACFYSWSWCWIVPMWLAFFQNWPLKIKKKKKTSVMVTSIYKVLSHEDFPKIATWHSLIIIVAFPPARRFKKPVVSWHCKSRVVV